MWKFLSAFCCLVAAQTVFASDLVISEFMASNTKTLADETGRLFPDWIEIHNTTVTNIDLGGWYLTGTTNNMTKWRFPSTNIGPDRYLVVFADGQDKAVAGAPLHTSFKLSADGDYLALVRPDRTIASEFFPNFPQQVPDVSYGFGRFSSNSTLISTTAVVRVRIPANGNEGTNWTMIGYDDSLWTAGTNGVGFAASGAVQADYSSVVLPMQPVAYWRMNETAGTTAVNLGTLGAAANGTYGNITLGTAGPRPPSFNGFEADNNAAGFNGTSSYVTAGSSLLSGHNTFTMAGWINLSSTPAARTGIFGQNDCVEFGFSATGTLQAYTPSGSTSIPWNLPNNTWVHLLVVGDGTTVRVFTNGVQAGSANATGGATSAFPFNIGGNGVFDSATNWFPGQIDEVALFYRALSGTEITALYQGGFSPSGIPLASFIKTDVSTAMSNVNASAYIRLPFTVADTNNVALMTLRARYNDGFVAYINGIEVARANVSDPVAYNSVATTNHGAGPVDFRISGGMLANGTNILAIQGLNVAANDTNFLIVAELFATSPPVDSPQPVYFTAPTPGSENLGGIANPGPAISQATHTPNVPRDDQDITVTARITRTFNAVDTNQVVVRYRVMFNPVVEIQMLDDGLHGDGAANDGVFGATLPTSAASTNGEMIRWYISAKDSIGNSSRWPIFAFPTNTEYLGTIVEPLASLTSKLPIIHIFAPTNVLQPGPTTSQIGADSDRPGGFVSLFYDGEFYDNVQMNLRGNSTAGYNKKSHHLNFTSEHPFRPPYGRDRLHHTSFQADWADPAYMRQALSFWLTEQVGIPSPFYDPVRLQLNTQFYQLAGHNNVVGAEQLDWMGFDRLGALYKSAGQVVPSQASTGGFEKKTRLWEDNSDYAALANGIAEGVALAQRRTNAFEMFDVPAVLNYIVAARWVHENDDVWANMTLYRDTLGDRRWRVIPFDMNLSWGAIFAEGDASLYNGVQATNDTHKSHPFYGGQSILARSGPSGAFNRVYDIFFQVPELRQMYLRRMRTMLDTWIKPIGTPTNSTFVEKMILARRDLIADEAIRDRAKWGWPAKGGQGNFDPGINITNGVDQLLSQFFIARRYHFYGKHSITNTALAVGITTNNTAGIPLAQPNNAVLQIAGFEANPSSGIQGHEYIAITNPNPFALDISGWKIDSGAKFTFAPGTVMTSNSVLYVTPDLVAFRDRTTTPKAGQGLFVVGNYKGQLSARGETIVVRDTTDRIVASNSFAGSGTLAQQYLRITEIMYHPGPTNGTSPYGQEEYEYIELKNIGPVSLSLVGVHFTNGLQFAFTAGSAVTNLAAGQRVVLVKNPAAFVSRYGSLPTIAGTYIGSLDNSGERLQLHDGIGEEILDFSYNNSWYPVTDGLGFSLVIVDDTAPFYTWDNKASWRPSGVVNGSPGLVDPTPASVQPVLVNEVLANSPVGDYDAIELWNPTTNTASIGNWFLSDDFYNPKKFRIPAGTTIPPGGYRVYDERVFNTNLSTLNFAFSSLGDEAYVFAADAAGNLLGYYHGFHFGASDESVTFGRYVTSETNEHFVAQQAATLGAANAGPRVGPVVISEIMYHPPDVAGADDQSMEYVELLNISASPVALYDTAFPTNHWKLKDGVNFEFSTNTVMAPGQYLLVVSFDPQTNAAALAAFRSRYNLDPAVAIVGPYSGKLDNSSDNVELAHPQPPSTNGFDHVITDKVDYKQSWSAASDGFGASLQRVVPGAYGNDRTNWIAAAPTPGAGSVAGTAPVITTDLSGRTIGVGQSATFSIAASGIGLRYQWRFNGTNIDGATNASLLLSNAQMSDTGDYSVAVYNNAGGVVSAAARVYVFPPLAFLLSPVSQNGPAGTNAVFNALAVGNGPVRYQWQFNSNNIPGATNATLVISNAQIYANTGFYACMATDDVMSIRTTNATFLVYVKPVVTNVTTGVTVVQGQTATFKVVAGPDHPMIPITYKWLIIGGLGTATNTTNSVLYLNNCTTNANASLRLGVTSAAGLTNVIGLTAIVLPDSDLDGIPDAWEIAYGFNPTNNADGAIDSDGDGMSNRDEYVAGTNPNDPTSLLQLTVAATNKALLGFIAQSNISYTIVTRTNLFTAPWQSFSNIDALPVYRSIQFMAPTNDIRFYRVLTPQMP